MLVWNRPALLFISLRLAAGAMGHGPEMFQTFNQQHNPLQKIWKNCKNLWSAKTRSPMGPDGPRWAPMGQPLKRTTTNLLAQKLLPDLFRLSQGSFFCFPTARRPGASSTRHRRFPGPKGARLHSSNTVATEFTGSEPSRL